MVVKFLLAVLIADVTELLGADAGVSIIEVADGGAFPVGLRVFEKGSQ